MHVSSSLPGCTGSHPGLSMRLKRSSQRPPPWRLALSPACSVRLPKNSETGHGVVLGEGKPENQNAAVIFCFGEVVQVGAGSQQRLEPATDIGFI